jgi:Peptidase family M23
MWKSLSRGERLYYLALLLLIAMTLVFRMGLGLLLALFLYLFPYPRPQQKNSPYAAYYRSERWSLINPFLNIQGLLQLMGEWLTNASQSRISAETHENKAKYQLPFQGIWKVANGGVSPENSHSWNINSQRYAYDFMMTDETGRSFSGDGKALKDYYCFGAPILSPAAGVVVRKQDGMRDYPGVGDYSIDWKTRDLRGNFVVIRHAEGEYSLLAHLQKGSITVRVGDEVKAGQVIARCGNSGYSTEPHLHFQLQDSANFFMAKGLPIRIARFKRSADSAEEPAEQKEQAYLERDFWVK